MKIIKFGRIEEKVDGKLVCSDFHFDGEGETPTDIDLIQAMIDRLQYEIDILNESKSYNFLKAMEGEEE